MVAMFQVRKGGLAEESNLTQSHWEQNGATQTPGCVLPISPARLAGFSKVTMTLALRC